MKIAEAAKKLETQSNTDWNSGNQNLINNSYLLDKKAGEIYEQERMFENAARCFSDSAGKIRGCLEHKWLKESDELFAELTVMNFKAAIFYEYINDKKKAADYYYYAGDSANNIKNRDMLIRIMHVSPQYTTLGGVGFNYRNFECCEVAYRNAKRIYGDIGMDDENERCYYLEQIYKRKKNYKNLSGMIGSGLPRAIKEALNKNPRYLHQLIPDIIKATKHVFTSWVFDLTSKYGLSIINCTIFSVVTILLFSALFFLFGGIQYGEVKASYFQVLIFSALAFVGMSDNSYSTTTGLDRILIFLDAAAGLLFFALLIYVFVSKLQRK